MPRYRLNESPSPAPLGSWHIFTCLFTLDLPLNLDRMMIDDEQSFSFLSTNTLGLFLNLFNIYVI